MELRLHDIAVIVIELTVAEPCHVTKKRLGDEALQSGGVPCRVLKISRADLASTKRNTDAEGWV